MSTLAPDDPLTLPRRPAPTPRPPLPLMTAVVPVIGAVVLWAVTGSAYALLFAALGPLIAVASVADAARTSRRTAKKDAAALRRELAQAEVEVARRHEDEREQRWATHPDVQRFLARPESIWRSVAEREAMLVVGSGDDASALRVTGGDGDDAATALRRSAGVLSDVPVPIPLTTGVAVIGPPRLAAAVTRALALQILLCLAPGRVRLGDGGPAWTDAAPHRAAVVGPLLQILEEGGLVGGDVDVPLVVVPEGAPPPPRCGAVLRLTGPTTARLDLDGRSRDVTVEVVSEHQAARAAELLSERATRALGNTVDLPITLRDAMRSAPAAGPGSLPAAFAAAGGAVFPIDLVHDGPHAVVIGMTGAGKSELLTSWVVSLCAAHTASQVGLLLVDFKGGRTFDHLASLPHVTGVLTDLDEPTTVRAIESLRAEVRYRERTLAARGARDIDEAGDALGRLVIVVDEYAALVAAHPVLHDVFGDLAARGRALGIHLILAAQRANGVFRDAVLANAPLRIALRVADGSDSRAVLGVDDACRLSGRPEARGTALVRRSRDTAPQAVRVALCDGAVIAETVESRRGDRARRPWLPALPERIPLSPSPGRDGVLLGVADEPEQQRQREVIWEDPALVVIGGPGSGRTGVLRAVAAQSTVRVVPPDPEGAWDTLTGIEGMPAGTTLLVDDLGVVLSALPGEYGAVAAEALESALRAARARGIRIVLTTQRVGGGVGRILELVPRRLILATASRADHVAAGGESADFVVDPPPGRGRLGRTLVQVVDAGELPLHGPSEGPPVWQPGRRPAAVVVPAGPRSRRLTEAWERMGIRVDSVDGEARLARGGVVIGSPDAWLAQWRLLAAARADGDLVIDAACAAEYRSLVGTRDLPPFAVPGASRAWVHSPDRPVRRVLLAGEGEGAG
ncbi:FtsK/SpoIIIE domain-containing protein [Microbacterium aquilitoris]|uniref:FtsK/SpoIIIE domain-containing protein n=1 Tax=Microbacterium aquilitoris TaxID=3067307 RepID=UPI0028922BD8|nr:FtsK/SpoIIIE domain-containing protein [Microbacterium sp. KSW2-22]MDT3344569.1 FtsK/SpoIIIE domain-containing protein [Microbacterium sp. KSW2-22]